ncbi:MAG: type II secretion system protein [Candidatus Eiseniibacteriota bacterium]
MNRRTEAGFTLVELMIVVVIIGVLASMAIPNMIAMQDRAKEGSLRANMHQFQLTAEDYSVQNDSQYAQVAANVVAIMPGAGQTFRNPFTNTVGVGVAWEDRGAGNLTSAPSSTSGITSYSGSNITYNIKGFGKADTLSLVLSAGQ